MEVPKVTHLKTVHVRIVENEISDTQFGFRNGMGTKEATECDDLQIHRHEPRLL